MCQLMQPVHGRVGMNSFLRSSNHRQWVEGRDNGFIFITCEEKANQELAVAVERRGLLGGARRTGWLHVRIVYRATSISVLFFFPTACSASCTSMTLVVVVIVDSRTTMGEDRSTSMELFSR